MVSAADEGRDRLRGQRQQLGASALADHDARGARVLAQFCALSLLWGSSFLLIKVGLEGLSPTQVATGRIVLGAMTLLLVSAVKRLPLPDSPLVWLHLGVVALFLCVAPFTLFAWAQRDIPSGLASIYNATTPLMTLLVSLFALPDERPDRERLAGLGLGFGGVLVVFEPWALAGGDGTAQLACLLATLCYGVAFVYLRRFVAARSLPAVSLATTQVTIAALMMLGASPWIAAQPMQLDPRVVASIVVLGAFGTGVAYVWNTNIVRSWGATNASTVTFVTPLIGVALGALLLDERLTWNQPVGAVIVVAGIVVGTPTASWVRPRTRRRHVSEDPIGPSWPRERPAPQSWDVASSSPSCTEPPQMNVFVHNMDATDRNVRMSRHHVIHLPEMLSAIEQPWSPRIVATVNDAEVRIARVAGEHVWHVHDDTDEFFMVLDGRFEISLRDAQGAVELVTLGSGDVFVVPRGVEHKPASPPPGAAIVMFERSGTMTTGDRHDPLPPGIPTTRGERMPNRVRD